MISNDPEILESPEDVLTTLRADGKRRWLYPVLSKGPFLNYRKAVGYVLVFLYIALPIIHIGGQPAMLLDFIHREFALFGFTFYPTDTYLLMLFGVGMVLVVVAGTALLGRVWCGWGCPQTVYLEFVFRPIERLVEGKEHVRKRRDEGPLTWDKAWRKVVKYALFSFIAIVLAHTFVAYFVGWSNLSQWMMRPPSEHAGFFTMMAFTSGLILFDFAYFREQMCTITCPYARMQSVLLDRDSLIVSYDPNRGEPRARRSKKIMAQEVAGEIPAQGDCIDCFACVRTCPTGIDIRDGLQMECIACTQCIDACDTIMDRIDKPRGLIRYTSENALEGTASRLLRPRTILYSVLITGVFTLLLLGVAGRSELDVNIGRAQGAPFMELPDGQIANRIRFRIRNQMADATSIVIAPVDSALLEMRFIGEHPFSLDPGEMGRIEAWVTAPRDWFGPSRSREAAFTIRPSAGETTIHTFTLLGPNE